MKYDAIDLPGDLNLAECLYEVSLVDSSCANHSLVLLMLLKVVRLRKRWCKKIINGIHIDQPVAKCVLQPVDEVPQVEGV